MTMETTFDNILYRNGENKHEKTSKECRSSENKFNERFNIREQLVDRVYKKKLFVRRCEIKSY